jgi:hypothetical protein
MEELIQNIRACLGCLSKSGSNDKNLAFLRPNRFFVTSYIDDEQPKNIADQLLILLPSDVGVCLVMDRLYGFRSLDILINHTLSVLKKAASVGIEVKVFIPKNSINSG